MAVVLVWYTMLYFLFRLSHYYACLLPDVGFRFFLPKTPDFYFFTCVIRLYMKSALKYITVDSRSFQRSPRHRNRREMCWILKNAIEQSKSQ